LFDNIEPSGKNILLAIDVSGSLDGVETAGIPGRTARVAAGAMAMVTARAEKNWHCVGFSSGTLEEYRYGNGNSKWGARYPSGLTELKISPKQRLDDVVRTMKAVPMGGTDCALPMLYAADRGLDIDVFHVYTDNETWAGNVHPYVALKKYRDKSGRNAKLAVVGMVTNDFTIADPSDAGMMDCVGFDTATPNILAEFAKQ